MLVSVALRSVFATNSLAPTYNRSLDTTAVYGTGVRTVGGGLLCLVWRVFVSQLRAVPLLSHEAARFFEVHVTHVYNDQMDSVFSDPEFRKFGKKKLERLKRPLYELTSLIII